MGFLERMLGNLMGGRLGGHHGGSKHGGNGGHGGYSGYPPGADQGGSNRGNPCPKCGSANTNVARFASNVAPPCRPANVPPAARNWPQAPSSVVNAEIRNLNAVYKPHFTQWGSTSSIMAEKLEKDLLLDLKAGWFAEHHSLIFSGIAGDGWDWRWPAAAPHACAGMNETMTLEVD